ncbi:asialoglycoprotein receptor 1-like [Spea bombifrons]|uniref:asialoglycoprotein receptor 1-like n=1 Tax=Spea bombifrons TaxID=233779 RepID=UPI00234A1A2F|nr:asialoglycoprotein receptor 1-like [Spea bombifrons]
MPNDHQDQQCLQPEEPLGSRAVFKMGSWYNSSSSRLLNGLCCTCALFLVIIIILIVCLRNPSVKEPDRSLDYKIGNLSVDVNSRVDRLSQDDTRLMDKLKDVEASLQKMVAASAKDTLERDMQRVLVTMAKLLERVKTLQVNGSKEDSCPLGWAYHMLSCYYFSKIGKSWDDSKKLCEEDNSHLVVINTEEEQEFVSMLSKRQFMWIGLTDVDGEWKWVDGTKYDSAPKNWIVGQPDEFYGHGLGGGEDCAHLHYSGEWNDDHCSRQYKYICEREV